MALETSILKTIKKQLGLPDDYEPFDQEILVAINSAFAHLKQLGVWLDVYFVDDENKNWEDLSLETDALGFVKTFMYLKVKLLFDPPGTSFQIKAIEDQIREQEWRLLADHDQTVPTTYAEEESEV